MKKVSKKKVVRAYAVVQDDGHVWGYGNLQFHIYPLKSLANMERNRCIGRGTVIPCTIHYQIPLKTKKEI